MKTDERIHNESTFENNVCVHVWQAYDLVLISKRNYNNPFRDVSVVAEFTGPDNAKLILPAFWDGGNCWVVRFAPSCEGTWRFKTLSSCNSDEGLHLVTGIINAVPWSLEEVSLNPNRKGFIRVHESGRYFTYADGTPFYWLGDTVWAAHTKRFDVSHSLPVYLNDRKSKGFTVIQMCMGHPAGGPHDEHSKGYNTCPVDLYANEGGHPYIERYSIINPEYFKYMDIRIKRMLDEGFVPCIMGMWAFDLAGMGVENAKEYWRYILARYSAFNVFWSISGEYYLHQDLEGWRQIGKLIHLLDPYGHPTSAHSSAPESGSRHFQNDDWYDFNLIQSTHMATFKDLMAFLAYRDYKMQPVKPSIMSESVYENHPSFFGSNRRRFTCADIRFAAYVSLLQGCIGQSYGAHGLWKWYDGTGFIEDEYLRPDLWENDLKLEGSAQMLYLRQLMESVSWTSLEPHPELVTSPVGSNCYCAAIPGKEYVVYVTGSSGDLLVRTDSSKNYEARWFNPRDGSFFEASRMECWWDFLTKVPDSNDWILVLKVK